MKHVLVTGFDGVTIGGVRYYAHAALLTRERDSVKATGVDRHQLRLFGTSSLAPIAQIGVSTLDVQITPTPTPAGREDLASATYTIAVGDVTGVFAGTECRPPVVDLIEDGVGMLHVWRLLERRVAESWDAPNIPIVTYLPLDTVCAALSVACRKDA